MREKPLRWLHGEVKTPPMSREARREMGMLLRQLQEGENLELPHSRPMPIIGRHCHELRVQDQDATWRLIHKITEEAIVILEVFSKKSQKTPQDIIEKCKKRLKLYEAAI